MTNDTDHVATVFFEKLIEALTPGRDQVKVALQEIVQILAQRSPLGRNDYRNVHSCLIRIAQELKIPWNEVDVRPIPVQSERRSDGDFIKMKVRRAE